MHFYVDEQHYVSEDQQLFEMDKHMQRVDDSLEYQGFFLLQGPKGIPSINYR
jgi:hypothetical protein